jgi:hypothetical protein
MTGTFYKSTGKPASIVCNISEIKVKCFLAVKKKAEQAGVAAVR